MRIAIIDDLLTALEYLRSNICRWADEHAVPLIPGPALFENGETFLEQFWKDRYDIIFLDIFMEGMNGMDTARRIRECDDACRLVFTTTSAEYAVDSYEVDSSYYLAISSFPSFPASTINCILNKPIKWNPFPIRIL